ncbi:MAG: hypothetical protein CBB68_09535 [Rhodospirillaceae bacterium TMED8]|nr:hypothetical protein [Magnetovibrio sp.]OUT50102.1 MAG: hypothetical protein CBB68_09535 [Rhodospirillaceae bacterium TMED8]
MDSTVNSAPPPPPWPNQASVQAREAIEAPAREVDKRHNPPTDEVSISTEAGQAAKPRNAKPATAEPNPTADAATGESATSSQSADKVNIVA